jgi:hypothetical protein
MIIEPFNKVGQMGSHSLAIFVSLQSDKSAKELLLEFEST